MQYDEVEIFVAPTKLYWVGAPEDNAVKKIQIELLKRDILLVRCNYDDLQVCEFATNKDDAIVLVNLDPLIHDYVKPREIYRDVSEFMDRYLNYGMKRSVFHTTIVDKRLSLMVEKKGYHLIIKNFYNTKTAIPVIKKITDIYNRIDDKTMRSYLRIQFYPGQQYRVQIKDAQHGTVKVQGFLKDLSLNGLGIIFTELRDFVKLKIKNIYRIKIFFDRTVVNIDRAMLRRLDNQHNMAGLYFNMEDPNMIHELDATTISSIVYKIIENILASQGYMTDLNFQRIINKTDNNSPENR